jgi:hypothetical protein
MPWSPRTGQISRAIWLAGWKWCEYRLPLRSGVLPYIGDFAAAGDPVNLRLIA